LNISTLDIAISGPKVYVLPPYKNEKSGPTFRANSDSQLGLIVPKKIDSHL